MMRNGAVRSAAPPIPSPSGFRGSSASRTSSSPSGATASSTTSMSSRSSTASRRAISPPRPAHRRESGWTALRARLLVLGAGAGRLAYDVHQECAPELTVVLDINPLLLFTARRMFTGERLELWESPLAPRESTDVAVRRVLCAPRPARPGIECGFADALDPPFAEESFDVVLTPWLVDIIDEDFAVLAARINRVLTIGGRWVSFGPLAFAQRRPALRYSTQEVTDLLEETGFSLASLEAARIPTCSRPRAATVGSRRCCQSPRKSVAQLRRFPATRRPSGSILRGRCPRPNGCGRLRLRRGSRRTSSRSSMDADRSPKSLEPSRTRRFCRWIKHSRR